MQRSGDRTIYSASDVSAFLACHHLATLEKGRLKGAFDRPPPYPDPGADVLRQRGEAHEQQILDAYRSEGLSVEEPAQPPPSAKDDRSDVHPGLETAAAHTLDLMRRGTEIIYQGVLYDGRWQGRPDFLRRVEHPSDLGGWSYEVVDAKFAREAKAGAILQVCFYSELLAAVQGVVPEAMHLALGGPGGQIETFRVADFAAYYRTVKARFGAAMVRDDLPDTYPEPCDHCRLCRWAPRCKEQWRADDHLSLVAGITRKQRDRLEEREVATRTALGRLPLPMDPPLEGVSDTALERIREQARIQVEGDQAGRPLHELFEGVGPGFGLWALPAPTQADLFFDIEGDPHAYDHGIEYLLGWVDTDDAYATRWALTPAQERKAFEAFIDEVTARRQASPGMHVYHYAPYEPAALKRLAARYATREEELDQLLRADVFVDLYRVVRQGLRASVESYSIKKLEPLYGFQRDIDLRSASSALANFEAWLQLGGVENGAGGAGDLLAEIEGYNRDDCVSTRRLRDWLESRRAELVAREGPVERPEPRKSESSEAAKELDAELQRRLDALLEGVPDDPAERTAEQGARWVLAHLLGWHQREEKSMWWEYYRLQALDDEELTRERTALGGLTYQGEVDRIKRSLVHRYGFPPQDHGFRTDDTPHDPRTEKAAGTVVDVDDEAGTIDLKRGLASKVPHPTSLIPLDRVRDGVLRKSIARTVDQVISDGFGAMANQAAASLLLARAPAAGQQPGSPLRRSGETNLEAGRRLAAALSGTVLPIQGPPGSGKTYLGARMIVTLLARGKRVGITGPSHKVVVNLLAAICRAAADEGVELRGIQKADEDVVYSHPCIEGGSNDDAEARLAGPDADCNLGAGTVWLWSRPQMERSLDVLFVDEAGQLSLANVLAASQAADSIVLLGDPKQLEQPSQGVHPPGAGASALEHLVGHHTLSAERGLFLEETWRLHPDLCAFTSELYYEGRLSSRPDLDRQRVDGPAPFAGAGLRFVPVAHEGNTSESPEEAEVMSGLVRSLLDGGATWTDSSGATHAVGLDDILVIAPYNAQVALLRSALPVGARVGTVDKFQGQQAPVVLFSPATSSAHEAPRGMSFLFSPNRLNVATSRALCLAVVVGSPELLAAECRSVGQMRLANGWCRLGEMAE